MDLTPAFVGIDLAYAKGKKLPVSICTWQDGRLIPEPLRLLPYEPPRGKGNAAVLNRQLVQKFVDEAATYIVNVCSIRGLSPKRIAIDAPSSPREKGMSRRAAELAMDQSNINCFPTPSEYEFVKIVEKVRIHLSSGGAENRIPHANQLWMLVGFRLFERLEQIAPCIEVFPQATARALGVGQVHKSKLGSVESQLAEAAIHTGWPNNDESKPPFADIGFGPAHDRLDAYLSAWVAALEPQDRIACGQPPKDVIWIPKLGHGIFQRPKQVNKATRPTSSSPALTKQDHKRICPGCNKYEFKRWPLGWDTHAAHRCTGLKATTDEERKREFKHRFGHMFKGVNS